METNAIKTSALKKRIYSQKEQTIDLNDWVFEKLEISNNSKILELCCGTGAQTKFLNKMMNGGSLDCVDINKETIEENRKSVDKDSINYHVSDIDLVENYSPKHIDLIFSSYGFYYSKNPTYLHENLYKKLNKNGKFVLVGPVQGNNIELYEIMKMIGVKINDNVLYSSEKFMVDMEEIFLNYYSSVNFHRALNKVQYDSADMLLNYWKNTTFYDNSKDQEFITAVESYYSENIVVTKSISYLEGIK